VTPKLGAAALILPSTAPVWAVSKDSLSGALKDPGGLPGASVALVNTELKAQFTATAEALGEFPPSPQ